MKSRLNYAELASKAMKEMLELEKNILVLELESTLYALEKTIF